MILSGLSFDGREIWSPFISIGLRAAAKKAFLGLSYSILSQNRADGSTMSIASMISQSSPSLNLEILLDTRDPSIDRPPEVSIVVPMYNVRNYVGDCLQGIFGAFARVDLELILIDDGSSDGTSDQVLELLKHRDLKGVLLVRQENQGLSRVRNLGAKLSSGEYLGFLDSDDLMVSSSLRKLLDFGKHNRLDLVLGRSFVFDSKTQAVTPFYDAWAFERLLQGGNSRVLSRDEEPELFFLEPNANYRLMKRSFYLDEGFFYPEGRLFEDPPVHYEMLAKARRIGLLNLPYYGYRVNRPGKITEERSHRRFDILEVAEETFGKIRKLPVSDKAGGAVLYGLTRIVWWCGTMTLPEDRVRFFEKAILVFSEVPKPWIAAFKGLPFPDEILHLILGALLQKDVRRLVELSQSRRNRLRSFLYLLRLRRWDLLRRHLKAALSRTLPVRRKLL